ncbi:histone-like nucleoid-structuring protein Lsr2 (plasmid) [Streptomyces sp. CA-142005]|uniref:histone-like nucleoid-structuring protein Lsr2 n=1 Tax=Streptomyces sp. CA-142005 TaxID=3240052 RepID=UPI003D936ED7
MAQKVITVYTDDLTGEESEDVQTHAFSLNGVTYEIDLTSASYDGLADALRPFIEAGRKTGRLKTGRGVRKASRDGGPAPEEVRAWARENDYEVNDRGRVPGSILDAYNKAH